ncbi:MAG: type II secretion system protein [Pirellulales bacterium]
MNTTVTIRTPAAHARRPIHRGLRLTRRCDRADSLRRADGFTLIELMVSIAVIGIIAAFLAGAVFAAQEAGRKADTEALIAKLHSQMAMRWEDYATRRVGISPTFQQNVFSSFGAGAAQQAGVLAAMRVLAIQEMMRFELPDQYIDIVNPMQPDQPPATTALRAVPSLNSAYRRRISRQVVEADGISWTDAYQKIAAANQSSECLYLIMTTGMIDETSGGEYFTDSDVGDTDDDGMLEFVDGWGRPIEWIRWPTAFVSDLQPDPSGGNLAPDPFNPTHVDEQTLTSNGARPNGAVFGYRLTPLIVSLGRDGYEGIHFVWYDPKSPNAEILAKANDPYGVINDADYGDIQRGQVRPDPEQQDRSYEDNVHNHLVGTR